MSQSGPNLPPNFPDESEADMKARRGRNIALALGLVLGTAGLPHILVRFYTVPDAKTARNSVVWATAIIGVFYVLTTFFGFGAATLLKFSDIPPDRLRQ